MENAKVKLVTMITAILFFVGGGFNVAKWMTADALWKQRMEIDMTGIREDVAGTNGKSWNHREMRTWTDRFEDANPELFIPNPDEIETR